MKKGRKEPNPMKIKLVDALTKDIKEAQVLGIIDLEKMPSAALLKIKTSLKGKAKIKVAKKRMIRFAFEKVDEKKKLLEILGGQPALLFSNENPFKLYKIIKKSKSFRGAKPGETAPRDIEVKAGLTDLPPGPAISTLSKAKIPAKVEGGKITVIKDVTVCKKGDVITGDLATALNALKIAPIEISLTIKGIWERGTVYLKDVLDIDEEKLLDDFAFAYNQALNLALNSGYICKETIEALLAKAEREANALEKEIEK